LVYEFDVLTQVIKFTSLMSLPIKSDMFILVSGPLIFLIIFLFHSYSILDWLINRIHGLFFSIFYRVIMILNKYFFSIDVRF